MSWLYVWLYVDVYFLFLSILRTFQCLTSVYVCDIGDLGSVRYHAAAYSMFYLHDFLYVYSRVSQIQSYHDKIKIIMIVFLSHLHMV